MAAIYSNGGNRWNILGFNFTQRDALSSVYKISMEQACSFHCQPANSGSVFVELIYYIFIQAKTQVSRENTKNVTLKREEKILFTVKIPKFLPLKYKIFLPFTDFQTPLSRPSNNTV
jgi:hypothetical protein